MVEYKQGDHTPGRPHLLEALRTATEIRAFIALLEALSAIACFLIEQDDQQALAVELYALALRYPYVANSRWFEDVAGRHIAAAAKSLPPDVVAAAEARGRSRDLWATAAELLVEWEGG
jgi:hypothetical protein